MHQVSIQYGHKDRKDVTLVISSDKIAEAIRRDAQQQVSNGGSYNDTETRETYRLDWRGAVSVSVMPWN